MIPITKPLLGEEEALAAARVIRSGWLVQGSEVARFEQSVAELVGARHAVAVSSGTCALHLALVALGIAPDDEVIVPSLGFIATANVVLHAGGRPVLVDVDSGTFNLDPRAVAAAITPRTRVVIPVHQLGLPAEMTPLLALADTHGLALLEDAACALGSEYHGQRAGSLGRLGCFSFHPRKVITTGEGGMVTTDDDGLADTLRALRSHGMTITPAQRHQARQVLESGGAGGRSEQCEIAGFNFRMTDVQAAVGLAQLQRLPEILRRRRQLARRYDQALAGSPISPPVAPAGLLHTYQSYMVLLPERCLATQRDAVIRQLLDQEISTRRALMAIHQQPLYRRLAGTPATLPVTEQVARRGMMLPLYPQLSEGEQDHVVRALIEAVERIVPG